jgi:CDP-diacylglycerol--glycerol-3-phosphate 3-phosphatidyltransferase
MAKILSDTRAGLARVVDPVARALLRARITPDMVTIGGAVGVIVAGVVAATGHLLIATLIAAVASLTDMLDGAMARIRGSSNRYGALLDSSVDRLSDGVIFASLTWYFAFRDQEWGAFAAILCLITSQLVSYIRARAEGLGLDAKVGLVERPERLLSVGVGGLLAGFGVPYGMHVVLWILGVLSVYTVGQRMVHVWKQTHGAADPPPEQP